jgi:PAS domain-containing protein
MILHATEAAIAAALLQELLAGVVVVDGMGRVRCANRSAAEILGRTREECLGLGVAGLFGTDAAAEILRERVTPGERRLATPLPLRASTHRRPSSASSRRDRDNWRTSWGERSVAVFFCGIDEEGLGGAGRRAAEPGSAPTV